MSGEKSENRYQLCQEAVQGLLKVGRIDQVTKKEILLLEIIANTAAEKVAQQSSQDAVYETLVFYFKDWLLSAIEYDTALVPVTCTAFNRLNNIEVMRALEYVQQNILKDKRVKEYFGEDGKAIAIINQYIGKLIDQLSQVE